VQDALLTAPPALGRARGAHYLLPNYDEYLIAYKDRGAFIVPGRPGLVLGQAMQYPHQVVIDGRVAGSWRRTVSNGPASLSLRLYATPTRVQAAALEAQAKSFGRFLSVPCTLKP
jgi:hypothetical protein